MQTQAAFSVGATDSRLGDHPASLRMVLGGLSSEVKRPRPEAGLTPQSSAEGKNKWNYTFQCLHGTYAEVEQKAVEKEALKSARSSSVFSFH
jgi:hypothetical protein